VGFLLSGAESHSRPHGAGRWGGAWGVDGPLSRAAQECPAPAVLHDSWGETAWLQSLGFYSLECWVANRVELLLWRGWHEAHARTKPSPTPAPSPPPPSSSSSSSLRGLVCKSLAGALCEHRAAAAAAAAAPGERGRPMPPLRCHSTRRMSPAYGERRHSMDRVVDDIRALISFVRCARVCVWGGGISWGCGSVLGTPWE
jgi:hypothetical protein